MTPNEIAATALALRNARLDLMKRLADPASEGRVSVLVAHFAGFVEGVEASLLARVEPPAEAAPLVSPAVQERERCIAVLMSRAARAKERGQEDQASLLASAADEISSTGLGA